MSKEKRELDTLWAKTVKDRDEWTCQLCGMSLHKIGGHANAHHILKKQSYRLRYDLLNGVCLCQGCHRFGVHSEDGAVALEHLTKLKRKLGPARWKYLEDLKQDKRKLALAEAREMLERDGQ